MSAAHQTAARTNGQHHVTAPEANSRLLDQILDRQAAQACRAVQPLLEGSIAQLEELLPPKLKGQAVRLAKRALMTFARNAKLQQCSPESFVRCVLEAAEHGLAIDGRLAHAVPYGNVVQFQCDYKGMVAVARRAGLIKDVCAEVIRENDTFEFLRGTQEKLTHTFSLKTARGKVVGVWAKVTFPDGSERYEVMNAEEINAVRSRSRAANAGPWKTDEGEMMKKTVIRRMLKTFCFDDGFDRLLEWDEPADPPKETFPAQVKLPESKPLHEAMHDRLVKAANWKDLLACFNDIRAHFPQGEVIEGGEVYESIIAWAERCAEAAKKAGGDAGCKILNHAGKLIEDIKLFVSSELHEGVTILFEENAQALTA